MGNFDYEILGDLNLHLEFGSYEGLEGLLLDRMGLLDRDDEINWED